MDITRGTLLEAVSARGELVRLRALTGRMAGRDFPVVWVVAADEFSEELERADGIPWPADEVSLVSAASV